MLSTTVQLLFILLRQSLWQNADKEIHLLAGTSASEWDALLQLSVSHGVAAIVHDAFSSLSSDSTPTQEVLIKWTGITISQERHSLSLSCALTEIHHRLLAKGIDNTPFKGAALAACYPHPLHRQYGDIDLYIKSAHRKEIAALFSADGGVREKELAILHDTYKYKDILWEFHFRTLYLASCRNRKILQKMEERYCRKTQLSSFTLQEETLPTFPPIFNIIYLTGHIGRHLLAEQIHLRQICDWAVVLHHERTALGIGEQTLLEYLDDLGMTRLYRALGHIAVRYFGLDASAHAGLDHLSEKDARRGDFILQSILDGHFPHCKPYQAHNPNESFMTKVKAFWQLVRRCQAMRDIYPRESFFTPFSALKNAFFRRIRN